MTLFKIEGEEDDLSDKKYLADKANEGVLISDTAVQTGGTIGDLGSLTADPGFDMYLMAAKATLANTGAFGVAGAQVVLKINGIIQDRWFSSFSNEVNLGGHLGNEHDFLFGFKVLANQIIKLQVLTSAAEIDISGTIQCIQIPSGSDP